MTQKKLPENPFEKYIRAYWREAVKVYAQSETTEHSGRSALEQLFKNCARQVNKNFIAIHEPKQQKGKAPDFAIKDGALFLGYVEVKNPSVDLKDTQRSKQIEGYLQLSENLLVTNYHSWALHNKGKDKESKETGWGRVVKLGDLENASSLNAKAIERLCEFLRVFFDKKTEPIAHVGVLAEALAVRAKKLKEVLSVKDKLHGLYKALQKQVASDLSIDDFKDGYAQTVVYGLFLAKLNAPAAKEITLTNAKEHITESFPVIKELTEFLYELRDVEYGDTQLYVKEILAIINNLDLFAIQEQMTFRYWRDSQKDLLKKDEEAQLFARDPFVYFYEDFLKAYDEEKRKARGVYFTPPPIVHFIVKSIEEILCDKKLFAIKKGLSDQKRVTLLDFATGTGTFLAEAIRIILDKEKYQDNRKNLIEEHILKNIYGFEFLIAPYVAAHLKLSQVLKEYNYGLKGEQSIPVYLANTLEEDSPQRDFLLPALSAETKVAHSIKEKPILVITGNPPYKVESENRGEWITKLIVKYRENSIINGHGIEDIEYLGERNPKCLQDDYVKFIAFAQHKMREAKEGVVGIITNHSFIDNPTFRLMRQSLMNTFEQIYILDLHGNSRKKEETPDGSKDKNVFDIQQGVAISFFIKKPGVERGIYHAEFWGTRRKKYINAYEKSWKNLAWKKIEPAKPLRLFVPYNIKNEEAYNKSWALPKIFPVNSVAIATARDQLTIQYSKEKMFTTIKKFTELETEKAKIFFSLPNDAKNWQVNLAQNNIKKYDVTKNRIIPIAYRIFDHRYIYYTPDSSGFLCRPRHDVTRHMLKNNLGLISCRQCSTGEWRHIFITNAIVESCVMSNKTKEANYLFPLYLYRPEEDERKINPKLFGGGDIFDGQDKRENIAPAFRASINERYPKRKLPPEQILAYIYAILHDQQYRQQYQEFLKYDFPRIPFPEEYQPFAELAILGQGLIDAHLLESSDAPDRYAGVSENKTIERIRFEPAENKLYFNNKNYFENISQELYDFHIGSYKVLEKYLKERKKRGETIFDASKPPTPAATLTASEISHISSIIHALEQTQKLMQKITEVTIRYNIYQSS